MHQNQTIQESASPTVIHLYQIAVVADVAQMRMRLELLWGFLGEYWHGKEFAAKYTAHQIQTSVLTICVVPKDPHTITSLKLLFRTKIGLTTWCKQASHTENTGEHSSRKLTLTQDRMKQNKANMHVGSSVQLWALLDTNVILLPLLLVTFDLFD